MSIPHSSLSLGASQLISLAWPQLARQLAPSITPTSRASVTEDKDPALEDHTRRFQSTAWSSARPWLMRRRSRCKCWRRPLASELAGLEII